MRNEVTIDGVKLTREQVDKAWRILNQKEGPKHFSKWVNRETGKIGIAIRGEVQLGYAEGLGIDGDFTIIDDKGNGNTFSDNAFQPWTVFWDEAGTI